LFFIYLLFFITKFFFQKKSWESPNLGIENQIIPSDNLFGYQPCECTNGFLGENCDIQINDCSSNPCQNGGTCLDKLDGFECYCSSSYSGQVCEKPASSCSNGGTLFSQPILNGLMGNYLNFNRLQGVIPTLTTSESSYRRSENINFDWFEGSPYQGINRDGFTIVWDGAITVSETGRYNFYITADDGVRVYIGNYLVVDAWVFQVFFLFLIFTFFF